MISSNEKMMFSKTASSLNFYGIIELVSMTYKGTFTKNITYLQVSSLRKFCKPFIGNIELEAIPGGTKRTPNGQRMRSLCLGRVEPFRA